MYQNLTKKSHRVANGALTALSSSSTILLPWVIASKFEEEPKVGVARILLKNKGNRMIRKKVECWKLVFKMDLYPFPCGLLELWASSSNAGSESAEFLGETCNKREGNQHKEHLWA